MQKYPNIKLVIADDSPMIRERIKNYVAVFEKVAILGEAVDGKATMALILEFVPDLIILDLHMPEMGGMEVLRKIKEAGMKTKVCILTNYSYSQYQDRCLALGTDYFLNKSEDFEKINFVISSMLEINDTKRKDILT